MHTRLHTHRQKKDEKETFQAGKKKKQTARPKRLSQKSMHKFFFRGKAQRGIFLDFSGRDTLPHWKMLPLPPLTSSTFHLLRRSELQTRWLSKQAGRQARAFSFFFFFFFFFMHRWGWVDRERGEKEKVKLAQGCRDLPLVRACFPLDLWIACVRAPLSPWLHSARAFLSSLRRDLWKFPPFSDPSRVAAAERSDQDWLHNPKELRSDSGRLQFYFLYSVSPTWDWWSYKEKRNSVVKVQRKAREIRFGRGIEVVSMRKGNTQGIT